jgi:hypothetical protein
MRNRILKRISSIPENKLKQLDDYISKLEKKENTPSGNLSFAGSWKDIDNSVFEEFTTNLVKNRTKNRSRINE